MKNNEETDAQFEAWLDQEDRRMIETIRRHRWAIESVMGKGTHPPLAYTVGLFGLGHPELIVFGLSGQAAGHTLNWFAERVLNGGDLMVGEIVAPEETDARFRVEEFPDPGSALYSANRFYQRPREVSVPAFQLIWDVNGAFPGEPGYKYPAWLQPLPGEYREMIL